jgi:protein-tyrosine-phosphatase
MKTRILFICTGNIARSQIAEGLARSMVTAGVEVASAGTRPNPKGIHPFAVEVLREKGVDISGHHAKKIEDAGSGFDYVITLCDVAAQDCPLLVHSRSGYRRR